MIDSNERLTYLESRHANNTKTRVIQSVISALMEVRKARNMEDSRRLMLESRMRATKNLLFLKYCGIEYEGIFQSIFKDRKFDRY